MTLFSPIERMLAWRYLRARRREGFIAITTWFAVIGIALGVATLILVTSLMNGIRDEMASRFIGIDGHVTIYSNYQAFTDYALVADQVKQLPEVASVTPHIEGQVMVTANGRALGAQVTAMPFDALQARPMFANAVTEGSLDGLKDGEGIVLGSRLAQNLGVAPGGAVTLISPQGRSTIAGFIPRMKTYPVVATVKLGMHALDSGLVIMPFTEAQNYFLLRVPPLTSPPQAGGAEGGNSTDEGGAVSDLQVMVKHIEDAGRVAMKLRPALPLARIYDWQQSNAGVFAALTVQRNVMVIILGLIVLVAAFNIISSLVMLVKDKSHDVAILRTMGMRRAAVMRIFMLAGSIIGVLGTAIGVVLGLVLAANLEAIHHLVEKLTGQELLVEDIYFLSTLPTKTEPLQVLVIIVLALALSFLATIYPARRAASLDPVEALRDE